MPQLGEIKKAREIGKLPRGANYIWHACTDCGKERWVKYREAKPENLHCQSCSNRKTRLGKFGSKASSWKGGRKVIEGGYIRMKLYPDDFFHPMADKNGYVLEHRLVVAKALGRNLNSWEIVHHLHAKYPVGSIEDKQDNRYPENLQLVLGDKHNQITILENRISYLEKKIEKQGECITRVKFLESEYNRIYHTEDLLYNEILRLIGIINLLNKAFWEKRNSMTTITKVLSNELSIYNKELIAHFQSHYRDKKKKEEYFSKRKVDYKYTN